MASFYPKHRKTHQVLLLLFVTTVMRSSVVQVSSYCIDSPPNWHEEENEDYNCDWYADNDNCSEVGSGNCCTEFGNSYVGTDGLMASAACCVCGGGQEEEEGEGYLKDGDGDACMDYTMRTDTNDDAEWHDSEGEDYSCAWYADTDNCKGRDCCEKWGDRFANDEMTANDACCVCGGGDEMEEATATPTGSPTAKPTGSPTAKPTENPTSEPTKTTKTAVAGNKPETICENLKGDDNPNDKWFDSYKPRGKFDCEWYEEVEKRCSRYGDENEQFGLVANQACCTCGGGEDKIVREKVTDTPTKDPTIAPFQSPTKAPEKPKNNVQCSDVTVSINGEDQPWTDKYGSGKEYDCEWYKLKNACQTYGNQYRQYFLVANQACCVCGGGNRGNGSSWSFSSGSSSSSGNNNKKNDKNNSNQISDYAKSWVQEHNSRRKDYHEQYGKSYVPVQWDETLAQSAQNYAKYLVDLADSKGQGYNCKLKHQLDEFPGGENLASNGGPNSATAADVLWGWTEREHDGGADIPGIIEKTPNRPKGNLDFDIHAHFTQVVWRGTSKIGCGHATKQDGACSIQVCRYAEPGNCGVGDYGNNIPASEWQESTFADKTSCKISSKWWANPLAFGDRR